MKNVPTLKNEYQISSQSINYSPNFKNEDCFTRNRRYGILSTRIYIASLQRSNSMVANFMGLKKSQIIQSSLTDEIAKFLVIVDHDYHSIAVVIRGTFCLKDVLTDLLCESVPFQNGKAHRGFLQASELIINQVWATLKKALRDHQGYELILAGHSMGGSVAEIITMKLIENDSYKILPPGCNIRCVSVGPAPCYVGELSDYCKRRINIYINEDDFVPHLSLGSFHKIVATLKELDAMGLKNDDLIRIVGNMQKKHANLETVKKIIKKIHKEKFSFLYHPGTLWVIKKCDKCVTVTKQPDEISRFLAENLDILNSKVAAHFPIKYENNFKMKYYIHQSNIKKD